MAHSMLLQSVPACSCIMHALYLCTASTTWHTSCCCKGYQHAAAPCMRSSCALQVRHATHHAAAKCTSPQLHHACALYLCTYDMTHSMLLQRVPACSCTMHALYLCTASTTCYTACCCKGYQHAAAPCMRSIYALQVRHDTHNAAAKCTSPQLHHACALYLCIALTT
jgi:hypothetical protein